MGRLQGDLSKVGGWREDLGGVYYRPVALPKEF
jgi:hypothetical protein